MPYTVLDEICHPAVPTVIREWFAGLPAWVDVTRVDAVDDPALQALGPGERDAIALALSVHADLILIDERKGAAVALGKGFEVTGTLGILSLAARRDLVDLADAFARLKRTNFRYRQEIMDELLNEREGG